MYKVFAKEKCSLRVNMGLEENAILKYSKVISLLCFFLKLKKKKMTGSLSAAKAGIEITTLPQPPPSARITGPHHRSGFVYILVPLSNIASASS